MHQVLYSDVFGCNNLRKCLCHSANSYCMSSFFSVRKSLVCGRASNKQQTCICFLYRFFVGIAIISWKQQSRFRGIGNICWCILYSIILTTIYCRYYQLAHAFYISMGPQNCWYECFAWHKLCSSYPISWENHSRIYAVVKACKRKSSVVTVLLHTIESLALLQHMSFHKFSH